MESKIRTFEDKITTLDDRDNIELYIFDDNDKVVETIQSALEVSRFNKK